jgi:predicted RNA-binding Zn-ribbon protein involved in translation (DUF1610 family)
VLPQTRAVGAASGGAAAEFRSATKFTEGVQGETALARCSLSHAGPSLTSFAAASRLLEPQCAYTTTHKSHFTRHLLGHTGGAVLACGECGYTTIDRSNLARHRRTHAQDFGCLWCAGIAAPMPRTLGVFGATVCSPPLCTANTKH